MNSIQRAIASLFKIPTPQPRQRGYAGGRGNGAGLSGWITPQASADNDLWSALRPLIARSRSLYNDDSNVQAAVDELVATVVDDGLKLQSHVANRRGKGLDLAVNQRIEDAFNAWANNPDWCDVAGLHTFWQMQRIVQHNRLVDGGILIRCVKRRFGDSPIPFALELIDVDLLDDRTALINSRKNDIRMGVEVDGWRRPVAYWLFDSHPADLWGTQGQSYFSRPVDASEIIHVFNRQGWRAGQTRGTPALHAVILKARNLLGLEESEIVKSRVQSCMTVFVETEFPETEPIPVDDEGYAIRELFPGAVEYLSPGQKISAFDPSSPNPNLPAFVKHFQRGIARVFGMASYAVTGDLTEANYSSLREGTLKEWRRVRIMRDELSQDFCHPVFIRWLDAAVGSGAIAMPGDFEFDRLRYRKDSWFGRPMPWVDPLKDINAIAKEIELGLTTQTEVLAERGKDISDWCATKAQEMVVKGSFGLLDETEEEEPPTNGDRLEDEPKRIPRKQKKRLKR